MNDRSVIRPQDRHFWKAGKIQIKLFSVVIITLDFIILKKKKPPVECDLEEVAKELRKAAEKLVQSSEIMGDIKIEYSPDLKKAVQRIITNLEGYNKWKR